VRTALATRAERVIARRTARAASRSLRNDGRVTGVRRPWHAGRRQAFRTRADTVFLQGIFDTSSRVRFTGIAQTSLWAAPGSWYRKNQETGKRLKIADDQAAARGSIELRRKCSRTPDCNTASVDGNRFRNEPDSCDTFVHDQVPLWISWILDPETERRDQAACSRYRPMHGLGHIESKKSAPYP